MSIFWGKNKTHDLVKSICTDKMFSVLFSDRERNQFLRIKNKIIDLSGGQWGVWVWEIYRPPCLIHLPMDVFLDLFSGAKTGHIFWMKYM